MRSLKYFHTPLPESDLLTNDQRKEELLKMMIQAMDEMGYKDSAKKLSEDTNLKVEIHPLQSLKEKIIDGKWEEALRLVEESELKEEQKKKINFLINEQRYIELIVNQQYNEALDLLRGDLVKNCNESDKLGILASILMCSQQNEIEEKLNRKVDIHQSRQLIQKEIFKEWEVKHISSVDRFNKLIQQALSFQLVNCKYHESNSKDLNLLEDHNCQVDTYPSNPFLGFLEHEDQVGIVKFSNKGDMFITITKGCDMNVWEFSLQNLSPQLKYKVKKIHDKEVNNVNWSPNDKKILTASSDKKIRIWEAETGSLKATLHYHNNIVNSVLWVPGTSNFVSGGLDHYIIVWTSQGEEVNRIISPAVSEMLSSSDGKTLYLICAAHPKIAIVDLMLQTEIDQINEKNPICAATLSRDNKYLLTHIHGTVAELHLWNLQNYQIIQVFDVQTEGNLKLGLSLGGSANQFIAFGGKDGTIKVWHKNHWDPLVTLQNHTSTVNSVSWHPTNPHILISGSDDKTLCIWVSDQIYKQIKDGLYVRDEENSKTGMLIEENSLIEQESFCFIQEEDF